MNSVTIATTDSARPTLVASADSTLMRNHQPALPVSPQSELASVYDSNGLPIVLSFSPAGEFYAVIDSPGSPTGWAQIDLAPSLAAFGTARSFAVGQLPGGNIIVAVAVQDAGDPSTENLLIAPLSNDLSQTAWDAFAQYWTLSRNKVPGSRIDRIIVGRQDDGQGFGLPVVVVGIATSEATAADQYILKADLSSGTIAWPWTDFPTPTTMASIADYALGSISDLGQGLYILYADQQQQIWLVFKSLLNEFGRDYDRKFIPPSGAATLQVTAAVGGTTPLFVAGSSGVAYFSATNQGLNAIATSIAPAGSMPGIASGGLVVRDDQTGSSVTAVWALSGSSLYYFHSTNTNQWSTPLLLRKNVTKVAPLRNQKNYANELIYIDSSLEIQPDIYYMWQDPATSLWKQDRIPIHATDKILDVSTYTTQISFSDGAMSLFTDVTFGLTADSWLRVVVNGTTQILAPGVPVSVQPDLQGSITVINSVTDLSAPVLHLTSTVFAGTIDVDPAHGVAVKLAGVQSDGDVPVMPATLPSGVGAGDVSSAVKGLMQFHPASGAAPAQEIAYRAPGVASAPRLNLAAVRSAGTFGVSFADGGFKYHDAAAVAAHPAMSATLGGIGDVIEDLAGDVLEFLKSAADDVEHFVVTVADDVVTFVAKIGDAVANFVIDTAEKVFAAISWVFDKLGVLFDDLIKWLGFLFDWDDIVRVQKVFANLINQVIDYGQAELAGAEDAVASFFDGIADGVRALLPCGGACGATNIRGKTSVLSSGRSEKELQASMGSGGNYARYHVFHSGVLDGPGSATSAPVLASAAFLTDVVVPTLESVQAAAQQIFNDLKNAFDGGTLTLDQVIEKIAVDAVIGIIDAIKNVAVGFLKFFNDIISQIQSSLNDSSDIPFITAIYRDFVGGDSSILNVISLLFAIPTTIIYKIATEEVPFGSSSYGLDTCGYKDLLSELRGDTPPSAGRIQSFVRPGATPVEPAVASHPLPTMLPRVAASAGNSAAGPAPSLRSSNEASEAATSYSEIGGLLASLTGTTYDFLSLASAMINLDIGNASASVVAAGKTNLTNISRVQIVLASASLAASYPVGSGPEYSLQVGAWYVSWFDLLKSGVAALWVNDSGDNPLIVQKVLGLVEIAEGIVELVLSTMILAEQLKDDANTQAELDTLQGVSNILCAIGTGLNGATRLSPPPVPGWLVIGTGAAYCIGGVLDGVLAFVETTEGTIHD